MSSMTSTSESISSGYRDFALREALGVSPLYHDLALGVAETAELVEFLAQLPAAKWQPNLFFAVIKLLGGPLINVRDLKHWLDTNGEHVRQEMLLRSTQTNEPARCSCIIPVLAELQGPLAIIEVGASAGLNLCLDRYGYSYSGEPFFPPGFAEGAPIFECMASAETPIPHRLPQIGWRMGLDLNPLDITDAANASWLECLVWPGASDRLAKLRAAISIARREPPVVRKGDLLSDLPELIREVPDGLRTVVLHTAVLSYIPDQADRDAFASYMLASDAIWVCNESARTYPQFAPANVPDGKFVLSVNGQTKAFTGPHGQSIQWYS